MGDEKIHDLTHAYDNNGAFQPERRWMLAIPYSGLVLSCTSKYSKIIMFHGRGWDKGGGCFLVSSLDLVSVH